MHMLVSAGLLLHQACLENILYHMVSKVKIRLQRYSCFSVITHKFLMTILNQLLKYVLTITSISTRTTIFQIIRMNNERFSVPELLFHPSDVGVHEMGIAEALINSVQSTPEGNT